MKEKNVKTSYRLIRRNERKGTFYLLNKQTMLRESLGTSDKAEAQKLLDAANQKEQPASLNLQLGVVYLRNANPSLAKRAWKEAIDELASHGRDSSQKRCRRELDSKAFDLLRDKVILETTADDIKAVLKRGGSMTNNYMRRLHNLALNNGWIPHPIITPKQWEKPPKKPKRSITLEEHQKIVAAEQNEERRHYYELLWLIGAAQTDGSLLTAENIKERVLSYQRMKTKEWCWLQIGASIEALLKKLPQQGLLFPKIATLSDKDRAAEFYRRCKLLKIEGVSLHSYRYAWAERAYIAGYPERYAQAALGHSSKLVHHAYAKNAKVVCPPLEDGRCKVVPLAPAIELAVPEIKAA